MRAIVDGIERHPINRGFNYIVCDGCGAEHTLERSYFIQYNLNEARSLGWKCEGDPRVDLCPKCHDPAIG